MRRENYEKHTQIPTRYIDNMRSSESRANLSSARRRRWLVRAARHWAWKHSTLLAGDNEHFADASSRMTNSGYPAEMRAEHGQLEPSFKSSDSLTGWMWGIIFFATLCSHHLPQKNYTTNLLNHLQSSLLLWLIIRCSHSHIKTCVCTFLCFFFSCLVSECARLDLSKFWKVRWSYPSLSAEDDDVKKLS